MMRGTRPNGLGALKRNTAPLARSLRPFRRRMGLPSRSDADRQQRYLTRDELDLANQRIQRRERARLPERRFERPAITALAKHLKEPAGAHRIANSTKPGHNAEFKIFSRFLYIHKHPQNEFAKTLLRFSKNVSMFCEIYFQQPTALQGHSTA